MKIVLTDHDLLMIESILRHTVETTDGNDCIVISEDGSNIGQDVTNQQVLDVVIKIQNLREAMDQTGLSLGEVLV